MDRPKDALARFGTLTERAAVLGGALLGTSFDAVAFSWDEARLEDAVSLASEAAHIPPAKDAAWACGIACGELHTPGATSIHGPPPLEWGEPLAVASALARVAKTSEVLVDVSVPAIVSRELLTDRIRVGKVGGVRVRGFRVDSRKTWRSVAAADVGRMVDTPLMARSEELGRLMAATKVIILRADSGFGGSRMLAEVAQKTQPSRSLTLTPFTVVHEPLGSLRRAMAFVAATERITLPPALHPVLDRLLGAQGIALDEAALLISHQLRSRPGSPPPSILLDDATDLDEPSLEACSRAVALLEGAVRVVARIDAMSQLPRALARHSDGTVVTLGRLEAAGGQAIAAACTAAALEAHSCVQWARRGGGSPLGVIEAVAAGIVKGELVWSHDVLAPLKRTPGDEIARPVGYWILRCADDLRETSRDVLVALAHLGGEASVPELVEVVKAVAPKVDVPAELVTLRRGRWIRQTRAGGYVLMTRAHREAILESSRNDHMQQWRTAVAKVFERADGTLRRAEAAQHAARAGLGEWASRLAMAAARTAAQCGLEESASALAAFAGAQDPASPDLDLGALPIEDDVTQAAAGDAIDGLLALDLDSPPSSKDILEDYVVAEPVSYEGLLVAARDLRESRWSEVARRSLAPGMEDVARRGLLALARAYADEGRTAEALIHGLDALARMREARDGPGARTCLLFLARLYEQTARHSEAVTLKRAAESVTATGQSRLSIPPMPI
jgi:hypothetical protein